MADKKIHWGWIAGGIALLSASVGAGIWLYRKNSALEAALQQGAPEEKQSGGGGGGGGSLASPLTGNVAGTVLPMITVVPPMQVRTGGNRYREIRERRMNTPVMNASTIPALRTNIARNPNAPNLINATNTTNARIPGATVQNAPRFTAAGRN